MSQPARTCWVPEMHMLCTRLPCPALLRQSCTFVGVSGSWPLHGTACSTC